MIIVGVTGASGAIYAKRLVEEIDACLIMSKAGEIVVKQELNEDLRKLAKESYSAENLNAKPASGSSNYEAMVIVPCSMKTLSSIANGFCDNLISRASDVMLKQEKKLILVLRETPLNLTHIKNMLKAKQAGASILPACPGFYHRPKEINDLVNFIVGKILELLGIEHKLYKWSQY